MNTPPETTPSILVVDDDPDICEALHLALSLNGYTVRVALDRQSAQQECLENLPDLILMDHRMPGPPLEHFIPTVRALGATRIILMTGHRDPHAQTSSLGLRFALSKPFELSVMLTTVRNCMAQPAF